MNINIDGYNINYIDEGKKDLDYAILLLHGWGANLNCFYSTINLLKEKYRVLALDLPGFGKSESLKKSFFVDDYVNIVVDFLKKLNIKKVSLVGHSYGGRIIIKLNNRNVENLYIVNNVLIDAAGIKNKLGIKSKIKIYTYKALKFLVMLLPIGEKKYEIIESLKSKFGSKDYKSVKKELRDTLVKSVNEDLSSIIKNIKADTLIIWGERDIDTPIKNAKFMEKEIKNSGLVVIKNAGHFSFLEDEYTYLKVMASYFNI